MPRLKQTLDGWRKSDPPTRKKLPVEADVPEYLAEVALHPGATEEDRAVGDATLYAFYYLLRIGEYTSKASRADSKQTVEYELKDATFFKKNAAGQLRQLPRNAPDEDIMSADGCTLKLDNQKNGWKNVCVFQEWNGDDYFDGVRALGRRYCHIRSHTSNLRTKLSTFWEGGRKKRLTDKAVRRGLKMAATALAYPATRGIPIDRIDTHSLRGGGANALALSGYSDTQIQKMGRWKGATFKEYIREELATYSQGMPRDMRKTFKFVNVAAGPQSELVDITNTVVAMDYPAASAA